jgi:hypothetical protein
MLKSLYNDSNQGSQTRAPWGWGIKVENFNIDKLFGL